MKISALPALACPGNERLPAVIRVSPSCQGIERTSSAADNTPKPTVTAAGPETRRRPNRLQIEDRRFAVSSNAWHRQEFLSRFQQASRAGKRPFRVIAGVLPRRSGTCTVRLDRRPPVRPRRTPGLARVHA